MGFSFRSNAKEKKPGISLRLKDNLPNLGKEGYVLEVTPTQVYITAQTSHGVFIGFQTLLQLLPPEVESQHLASGVDWKIPCLKITDRPRFAWRGFMLDEGRHFHGKDTVFKLLDVMAMLKLNVFHWHLTEDQGWRIEIDKHPKLIEIGSNREGTARSMLDSMRKRYDGIPHSGFYTKEDIREIVAYAAERHIMVVPEIEIPGHCRAALAAYPEYSCTGGPFQVPTGFGIFKDVYCPGKEETFTFLEDILDEILELFPGSYIHTGGDEAPLARWKKCPDCQQRMAAEGIQEEKELQVYFTNRIADYLAQHGRTLVTWNANLGADLPPKAVIQYWVGNRKKVLKALREGRKLILSPYLDYYLDHSYSLTPLSRIYDHEPVLKGLSEIEEENILGVEAPLWTEFVPNRARLDYQTFPRLLALAETGWTDRENKDLASFMARLAQFEKRLDIHRIKYARGRDVEPPWYKKLFGLFTIPQPQRKVAEEK
jgi:hexosaminidase